MKNTIYAIGDVHGCHLELQILFDFIRKDYTQRLNPPLIIFLGDLIDRGPNSKKTMDICYQMDQAFDCIFIQGNHDDYLVAIQNGQIFKERRMSDYDIRNDWKNNGGKKNSLGLCWSAF